VYTGQLREDGQPQLQKVGRGGRILPNQWELHLPRMVIFLQASPGGDTKRMTTVTVTVIRLQSPSTLLL
jgi:hypothetical protein